MKQPYNTALYMRLSRDDENYGDSISIETQRTILRQFQKRIAFMSWTSMWTTDGAERALIVRTSNA